MRGYRERSHSRDPEPRSSAQQPSSALKKTESTVSTSHVKVDLGEERYFTDQARNRMKEYNNPGQGKTSAKKPNTKSKSRDHSRKFIKILKATQAPLNKRNNKSMNNQAFEMGLGSPSQNLARDRKTVKRRDRSKKRLIDYKTPASITPDQELQDT